MIKRLEIREEKVIEETNYVERKFYHYTSSKMLLQGPGFSENVVKVLK